MRIDAKWTVIAGFPGLWVVEGKIPRARALMSKHGIYYFYIREQGRKISVLEIQDCANQHAMSTYGSLRGFSTDFAFTPRRLSSRNAAAAARTVDMFASLFGVES